MDSVGPRIVFSNLQQVVGKLGRGAVRSHPGKVSSPLGLHSAKRVGRAPALALAVSRKSSSWLLYGFLGDEPHTPPRPAFRRRAAHQGDDPLALARVQYPPLARTRFLIQRLLPSLLLAAPGNGPHGLGSHAYVRGHLRRRLSLVQLAQDRGSPQHPRGLPPLVQHPGDLLAPAPTPLLACPAKSKAKFLF